LQAFAVPCGFADPLLFFDGSCFPARGAQRIFYSPFTPSRFPARLSEAGAVAAGATSGMA